MTNLYIGTSGFQYQHWVGLLYKKRPTMNEYLQYFNTLELNVTYYMVPPPKIFESWAAQPLLYSIKLNRAICNTRGFRNFNYIDIFCERAKLLGPKLAVILIQLSAKKKIDIDGLGWSIQQLKLKLPHVRLAFEPRHDSWLVPDLKSLDVSLVISDHLALQIQDLDDAPFIYIRRHGSHFKPYFGTYAPFQLKEDAEMVKKFLDIGRDVFIYYNNDVGGHAVRDALYLKTLLTFGKANRRSIEARLQRNLTHKIQRSV